MLLDQQTYDRLNVIEKGIEALWKTTDDIFEAFDKLYARVNTIEATIERLGKAVTFLEETVFPQVTVDPTELTEAEAAQLQPDAEPPEEATATVETNAGKDKTNEPSKTKPKAKKKTVRKIP